MLLARLISTFSIPALIVGASVYVIVEPSTISGSIGTFLPNTPYVLALLGALLAARFHQSRMVFSLAVLSLAYPALIAGGVAAGAALVLAPLNLLAFAVLSEKGILSGAGLFRLAVIGLQGAGVAWIAYGSDGATMRDAQVMLAYRFVDMDLAGAPLGQPALAALGLSLLILVGRAARSGAPLDGGLAGAVFMIGLAAQTGAVAVSFVAASVMIVVSVVQESYRLAYVDELTGLPGRRALMTAMAKLGDRYCVAMLDIDHFKKFNDTYGHDVGDQVLQMVATQVGRVGGGGKGFRYGGEEFTVLFPGRTAEAAEEPLENLRAAIEASGFKLRGKDRPKGKPAKQGGKGAGGKTVSVTISIGGADAESASDPSAALKVADDRLYKAKKAGRNRVVI